MPFARMFSGVELFGNAFTWWAKAIGRYDRGAAPKAGAVLVFKATGAMRVGHVATVSKIVSDRIIKVTHANWSIINGRRGQIENDVTVTDASPANDWSQVRVWYAPVKGLGTRSYPVYGFIYGKGRAPMPTPVTLPAPLPMLAPKPPMQMAQNMVGVINLPGLDAISRAAATIMGAGGD